MGYGNINMYKRIKLNLMWKKLLDLVSNRQNVQV